MIIILIGPLEILIFNPKPKFIVIEQPFQKIKLDLAILKIKHSNIIPLKNTQIWYILKNDHRKILIVFVSHN